MLANRLYQRLLLILFLMMTLGQISFAQSTTEKKSARSIFEALEEANEGEGVITIFQAPELQRLVGLPAGRGTTLLGHDGNYTLLMGYRVQMFNSNHPNAKAEAYARAEQIRHIAPTMSSYITFKAPFWRLAIGNFLTREEASQARARLVSSLPAWARESYVVRDKVRILNYVDPSATKE